MKTKVIMVGLLVVLALSLLACQSGAAEKPATPTAPGKYRAATSVEFYTCNDFMKQKHITDEFALQAGKGVTVILCSNPTTGFQWAEEAQISDPEVIEQVSHEYVAPTSDKPGAAGTEKFNFRGLKLGMATVSLEYGRPWEGGEQAEWTCTLTIIVD